MEITILTKDDLTPSHIQFIIPSIFSAAFCGIYQQLNMGIGLLCAGNSLTTLEFLPVLN